MAATKSKATNKKATTSKSTGGKTTSGKSTATKSTANNSAAKSSEPTKKVAKVGGKKATAKPSAKSEAASKPAAKKPVKEVTKPAPSAPRAKPAATKARPVDVPTDARALTVGDAVPAFEAVDQHGAKVTSESLAGAPYVIYFYPKDDTPGCTTEACGFRDEMAVFAERGVKVLGVSPDSSASHARFAQKYGLGFTLLADTEKKLVTLFGVWKLKQNYGREYWGVERSTFVVDAAGKIAKQWRGVKVAGHVPAVLEAVAAL